MVADFSVYTKAAELEGKLRQIPPGQRMRVAIRDLLDMMVPADPIDRQTPIYLADWFRKRMPFRCITYHDIMTGDFEFENGNPIPFRKRDRHEAPPHLPR